MQTSLKALLPSTPDVCLVLLKSWATEGEDRTSLHSDWNGDEVEKIASTCSNTVVVTHSNGVNILPWADHPNVTAILAAHLPGQEAGSSIVDVLWGEVNPSGHLPYTIAKSESDSSFAPIQNSTTLQNTNDPTAWQSDFEEGVLIDYRAFSPSLDRLLKPNIMRRRSMLTGHTGNPLDISITIINPYSTNSDTVFRTRLFQSKRTSPSLLYSMVIYRLYRRMQKSSLEEIPTSGKRFTESPLP